MIHNLKLPDPNVPPICDGRAWRGIAEAYGTIFVVELFPSQKHAGYYHYSYHCMNDEYSKETNTPIRADAIKANLTLFLMLENLHLEEFVWEEMKLEERHLPHAEIEVDE
jgi:hypothetical protein